MKLRRLSLIFLLVLLATKSAPTQIKQGSASAPTPAEKSSVASSATNKLPAAEFARLSAEMSESGGYFLSDNLISNETAYLPVLDKLKQLNATGGAYVGVGPEQNFTYIAKVRPQMAFIIDIRHMAVTQHLMYKAIFQLAADRAQFLSRLLSRPLTKEKAPTAQASIKELIDYFSRTPADEKFYAANLAEIKKLIQQDFQVKLSDSDQKELEYVLKNFKDDGIEIAFRFNGGWQYFPSLKEVLAQADRNGKPDNFLASVDDYNFVRELQLNNRLVPVNGDFAGKKALAAIGDYLRKQGLTVTAFYTSNVEQYLFGDSVFDAFVANVKKLPVNEQSLFIRSVLDRYAHPAHINGHLFTLLLQRIPVFLKDYDAGRYQHYYQLVSTNYISGGQQ